MCRLSHLVVLSAMVLGLTSACSDSAEIERVPERSLLILQERFLMDEVLEIFRRTTDRNKVKDLMTGEKNYHFMGTQPQSGMIVDLYNRDTLTDAATGYGAYFQGEDGPLFMIAVTVNPLNETAKQVADMLAGNAFDSTPGAGNSTLYFLGTYILDDQHILKIMLTKEPVLQGFDYNIRYGRSRS